MSKIFAGKKKFGLKKEEPRKESAATLIAKYKTELCRSFERDKTCCYGTKCQFAHGIQDLRQKPVDPRYKTKPCRNFPLCHYGDRCQFIHPDANPLPDHPLSELDVLDALLDLNCFVNVGKAEENDEEDEYYGDDRLKEDVCEKVDEKKRLLHRLKVFDSFVDDEQQKEEEKREKR